MLRRGPTILFVLASVLVSVAIAGCGSDSGDQGDDHAAAFGYGADDGPARWASLDPSYEECDSGRRQSPVDLRDGVATALASPTFEYRPAALEIEDNGHSLEAEYPPGSSLEIDGNSYELKQFHFHAPSEHWVGGRTAPLEFHFVHEGEGGGLLVLGVLVEEGEANSAASTLIEALPEGEGETLETPREVDPLDLLPEDPSAARLWRYQGSLTTPPCSEGVDWRVFDRPVEFSSSQVDAYLDLYEGTNRPVQPLNGRILEISR